MKVYVNDKPVDVIPGMTVRHALLSAGLLSSAGSKKVCDEWGNVIGFDGALSEGMKIYVESESEGIPRGLPRD